jgi:hypothetical protein
MECDCWFYFDWIFPSDLISLVKAFDLKITHGLKPLNGCESIRVENSAGRRAGGLLCISTCNQYVIYASAEGRTGSRAKSVRVTGSGAQFVGFHGYFKRDWTGGRRWTCPPVQSYLQSFQKNQRSAPPAFSPSPCVCSANAFLCALVSAVARVCPVRPGASSIPPALLPAPCWGSGKCWLTRWCWGRGSGSRGLVGGRLVKAGASWGSLFPGDMGAAGGLADVLGRGIWSDMGVGTTLW